MQSHFRPTWTGFFVLGLVWLAFVVAISSAKAGIGKYVLRWCLEKSASELKRELPKRSWSEVAMRRGFGLALVLAGLSGFLAKPVWAKPMNIEFKDAMARSETIAIVTLVKLPTTLEVFGKAANSADNRTATLNVLRVLKGSVQPGNRVVRFADFPHAGPGEFVVFIDKEGIWRFAAVPLDGDKVEGHVLSIYGFYDSNAHFVSPGLVTLAQLKSYLRDGSLAYTFRGHVWFTQPGKSSWKPSDLQLAGTYDAIRKTAHVNGLTKLAGFPSEPENVWIESLRGRDGRIHLIYSRRGDRPLQIMGLVDGLDSKTGAILFRFAVTEPDVLTPAKLDEYLADSHKGHCYYTFRLHCAATKDHPGLVDLLLTMDKESGGIGLVEGWGSDRFEIGSMEHDRVLKMNIPTTKGHELRLTFEVGEPPTDKDVFQWTFQHQLLYRVYRAPLEGMLYEFDGHALDRGTKFSVSLDSVGFADVLAH